MSAKLNIPVLLGSVRRGRQSPRVARWLHRRLMTEGIASELLDLEELALPIMDERIRMRDDSPEAVLRLSHAVGLGDGLVIVTPEYNNGYPGVLKNALDYLLPELKRKPVGIVTVSAGGFGGISCLAQLRLVLLAMGAAPIPASLPVSRVGQSFSDDGPTDDDFAGRADRFLAELQWWTEATVRQREAA
jgi:NAD(P)H-dependent FMN reductase